MLASEMIKTLQTYINKYGDKPVYIPDAEEEAESSGIRVYPYNKTSECCGAAMDNAVGDFCPECGEHCEIEGFEQRFFIKA